MYKSQNYQNISIKDIINISITKQVEILKKY